MDKTSTEPKITPLVRNYSLTMDQSTLSGPLPQALSLVVQKQDEAEINSERDIAEWNKWLRFGQSSSDGTLSPLENHRQELVRTWQQFQHLFHNEGAPSQPPGRVPSIETLRSAIDQAQDAWLVKKTKGFGKAKDRFLDFSNTMDDHSFLFNVIPSGDKYVCLIAGVVASVVQASVNYRKIADGFSLALVETCSDLHFVNKTVSISDSHEMRRLVVELYVGVFKLLCHAMDWFKRGKKRFFTSFNSSFHNDTVEALVRSIQKTVQRVKDEAQHIAHGRVERIEGMLVDHILRLRSVGIDSRNDSLETIGQKLGNAREVLGHSSARTLGSVENQHMYERADESSVKRSLEASGPLKSSSTQESEDNQTQHGLVEVSDDGSEEMCARFDIEKLTRLIAKYVEDGRQDISLAIPMASSTIIPDEVLIPMQRWIQAPESRMIWVEGGQVTTFGSGLSPAALRLYNISIDAGIPCVSIFCKPRYGFKSTAQTPERQSALISLLYSVITQLAYLLPPEFPAVQGLDGPSFHLLDGGIKSAPVALQLIRALLEHAPRSLIWVLDGLQLAEDYITMPYLAGFVDILREQEILRVSKVCFTTDGNSFVLMKRTLVSERVDASRMAQRTPGFTVIGGTDINQLGSWRG